MHIDHVAHTCHDPHETHHFYSTVLGLPLVQAYAGKELLLVYALPDGGSLAFSARKGDKRPTSDSSVEWERQHVGLTVATRAELDGWLERLNEYGVKYRLVDNERIYFADPDGLVLELEVASAADANTAAADVLARW